MTPNKKVWRKCNIESWAENNEANSVVEDWISYRFHCIYDVIRLHQVSGFSNYDDVMTKQVPGVPGANFVGRHLPSVPYLRQTYERKMKI